jgi:hypothetical protein
VRSDTEEHQTEDDHPTQPNQFDDNDNTMSVHVSHIHDDADKTQQSNNQAHDTNLTLIVLPSSVPQILEEETS